MNVKKIWNELLENDIDFVRPYIPYDYEIEVILPNKDATWTWDVDMWCWYFKKLDIIDYTKRDNIIHLYSEKPLQIPKKKIVLGETFKFTTTLYNASKQGGIEQGLKDWLIKKISLAPTLATHFGYKTPRIQFKYNTYIYDDRYILQDYTKLILTHICKANKICFVFDTTWDYAQLLSFNPITKAVLNQVNKELGEYIKHE